MPSIFTTSIHTQFATAFCLKCPSFSLLRNLITICIRIFLQNFGKMKKHRFFIDNLHSLYTNGWKCAVAQPIRLHHLDNRILLKLDRNTDNMFSISPMKFCNEKRKQLVYMYFDRHNRPLQKRERTGKEYGCFPFVWKTKIFKWKVNWIWESLPLVEAFQGRKWQNGSSSNITQNRVDRPQNYKDLYGILQLFRARKIFEFHLAHWASNPQILLARGTSPLARLFKLINNSWTQNGSQTTSVL